LSATKRGFTYSDKKHAALLQEHADLRDQEFTRLIEAAEQSGILDARFTKTELVAFLKTFNPKDSKPSKSKQLSNKLEAMGMREAQMDRKLDARQKILLGAFLMDLLNEDEDMRATLLPKLETFINRGNQSQATRNMRTLKQLMDGWRQ
jgi:hypothetical protein